MFCSQCGTQTGEEAKFCSSCGAPVPAIVPQKIPPHGTRPAEVAGPSSQSEIQSQLVDLSNLTRWLKGFLYGSILLDLVAIGSGILQYELLVDFKQGIYTSPEFVQAAAASNDARQRLVGVLQGILYLVTAFFFLKWIYRANYNARQVSMGTMKFTPGWAIGWYFIPVGNLWKPYQAMKEIYAVSKNPSNGQNRPFDQILSWWWLSFVVSNGLASASLRLMAKATEIEELINATLVSVGSDIASIILAFIAIALIKRIYQMQRSNFRITGPNHSPQT